jgi:asparagine synthase (glutamine-hydrolysing)
VCGIAGFLERGLTGIGSDAEHVVGAMADALTHRGPDDRGTWVDREAGVAFGHRRLSVIDLSPTGHQPMVSASGRLVLVFNGEIYNHRSLSTQLGRSGIRLRGTSDTEVLLEAIDKWGLDAALEQSNGMFAFALWDRHRRRLTLARDRMGEKPLYYGWQGTTFLFASELKAMRPHPSFRGDIDRDALAVFLRYGYVPAPQSIIAGMSKLPPATVVELEAPAYEVAAPRHYWTLPAPQREGAAVDSDLLVDELEALIDDSVALRMVADVPVGAFLSGGIDSSIVVAAMQQQLSVPVRTFTIGFAEAEHDEAAHARVIARRLGTDHTELTLTQSEAEATVTQLPTIYDEPFADSSQIPMVAVAKLARQSVTVALSGDGGDELFGGYDRYLVPARWRGVERVPHRVRREIARLAERFTDSGPFIQQPFRGSTVRSKLRALSTIAAFDGPTSLHEHVTTHWQRAHELVPGARPIPAATEHRGFGRDALVELMMFRDQQGYLPDDILTKVDRATMAVSLEARVPLLDHRLVEFAARIPRALKIRDGAGKWLLRQVAHRDLAPDLFDRPKHGFTMPINAWLRGSLRSWAAELLDPGQIRRDGLLEAAPVSACWAAQLDGADNAHGLWAVLVFQSWLEAWKGAPRR